MGEVFGEFVFDSIMGEGVSLVSLSLIEGMGEGLSLVSLSFDRRYG